MYRGKMKIYRVFPQPTAILICIALSLVMTACSGGDVKAPAFGELDSAADSPGGFNLADIQPDWAPNPARGQLDQTPLFNRNAEDKRVVGGDERRFFAVRPWNEGESPAKFQRTMQIKAGNQYQGYVYFHNSGNGADYNTTSHDTRVSLWIPRILEHKTKATAEIGSRNSSPNTVSSSVVLSVEPGSPPVLIDIVSAYVVMRDDKSLSYPISAPQLRSRAGVEIGCNQQDTPIAAGDQCWGQLLFIFQVHEAQFEVGADVGAYYGDGYDLSNTVHVRRDLERLVVQVSLLNPLNVDLNWVELGYAPSANPGPFEIVRDDSWLTNESNDYGEIFATLEATNLVRVGLLKANKLAVLRLNFVLVDWDKLCKDGQAFLWVWAKAEDSYRQAEKIRVFPDQC